MMNEVDANAVVNSLLNEIGELSKQNVLLRVELGILRQQADGGDNVDGSDTVQTDNV